MRRREFVTLIGGAVLSWPRVAIGQQARKVPTISISIKPHKRRCDAIAKNFRKKGDCG